MVMVRSHLLPPFSLAYHDVGRESDAVVGEIQLRHLLFQWADSSVVECLFRRQET